MSTFRTRPAGGDLANDEGPALIWPQEVFDYLPRIGRDPDFSCPLIERSAEIQFRALAPVFAERPAPRSILDIGCGLAVLDIHLARSFRPEIVHLLDGDGTGVRARGFKPGMQPWADAAMGAVMFRANAPIDCPVIIHPPAPFELSVDLIISVRSWGHHYPVETYLDSVCRSLNSGGLVVLDIRIGTNGLAALTRRGFEVVCQIPDASEKCGRFALRWT